MVKAYLNERDLSMRLGGCLVIYKGEPYTVVTEGVSYPNIKLKKLCSSPSQTIEIDHRNKELNISTIEFGYMNLNGEAYYVTRVPYRRQNQAVKVTDLSINPALYHYSWGSSKAFYNCIKGIYPRAESALGNVVDGKALSMAISREFAIVQSHQQKISLYFKGREVGYYNYNDKQMIVIPTPESSWIKNLIVEQGLI